ncbi:lanthionine synthetase C family protein [Streptomyces kronopolitis]|uniref:lanthionine synthetase C family protein n=1 Tax=Streptomyces kronopolitis TaxID=1612435 RepID=UPI00369A9008
MAEPEQVTPALRRIAQKSETIPFWRGPTLAGGFAGVAALHLHAARVASGPAERTARWRSTYDFLRAALTSTVHTPVGPGLWDGASGLSLVLADCCQDEPRFAPTLDRLQQQIAERVRAALWPSTSGSVAPSDYDVISGASGTLIHLSSVENPTRDVQAAAIHARDFLLWLSEPEEQSSGIWHWRWHITPERAPERATSKAKPDFPRGYLDVGMAHGVAGIVSGLAAAWQAGYRSAGLCAAMYRLTDWLLEVHDHAGRHGLWPAVLPLTSSGAPAEDSAVGQLGWCYGSTGCATALLNVARATGDDDLRRTATQAFDAALSHLDTIKALSLCHGLAGLAMGCQEFASIGSVTAAEALPEIVNRLLTSADRRLPYLFSDPNEPTQMAAGGLAFLTGAPGIALALLTTAGQGHISARSMPLLARGSIQEFS